jgi:hypothetical protein
MSCCCQRLKPLRQATQQTEWQLAKQVKDKSIRQTSRAPDTPTLTHTDTDPPATTASAAFLFLPRGPAAAASSAAW